MLMSLPLCNLAAEIIMALEEERDNGVHLSPRSPRPRRGSTEPKSPALRPVLASVENESEELVGPAQAAVEDEERGPIPSEAHSGPAVDEVEAVRTPCLCLLTSHSS